MHKNNAGCHKSGIPTAAINSHLKSKDLNVIFVSVNFHLCLFGHIRVLVLRVLALLSGARGVRGGRHGVAPHNERNEGFPLLCPFCVYVKELAVLLHPRSRLVQRRFLDLARVHRDKLWQCTAVPFKQIAAILPAGTRGHACVAGQEG